MFKLEIENVIKERLTLTQNEGNFQVYNIEGLNPPNAQINLSKMAGVDGSRFNSSTLNERNIVVYVKLQGNIEANRLLLYRYFGTKEYCKIYYSNDKRNVYIEGYVETCDVTPFTNDEKMQISIICPEPYFKDLQEIVDDISKVIHKFKFPVSINKDEPIPFSEIAKDKVTNIVNTSESETGLIVDVVFSGNVRVLEIRNTVTGEQFILDYSFLDNDKLIINCNKGHKSVTLNRDGVISNLIPSMRKGSKFFQLKTGDNNFSYLADGGMSDQLVNIQFKHYNIYRGV